VASWLCGLLVILGLGAASYLISDWLPLLTFVVGCWFLRTLSERIRRQSVERWQVRAKEIKKQAAEAEAYLNAITDPSALYDVLSVQMDDTVDAVNSLPIELYPVVERLLPKTDAVTCSRLHQFHHARLRAFIDIYNSLSHADLLIEILRLVERTKDTRAMSRVERLTEDPVVTTDGLRVKDTAKAILPALMDAARRKDAGDRLLRPSEEPEGILLRPAGQSGEMQDVLLRPGSED
jgi:hypothetical protein